MGMSSSFCEIYSGRVAYLVKARPKNLDNTNDILYKMRDLCSLCRKTKLMQQA